MQENSPLQLGHIQTAPRMSLSQDNPFSCDLGLLPAMETGWEALSQDMSLGEMSEGTSSLGLGTSLEAPRQYLEFIDLLLVLLLGELRDRLLLLFLVIFQCPGLVLVLVLRQSLGAFHGRVTKFGL